MLQFLEIAVWKQKYELGMCQHSKITCLCFQFSSVGLACEDDESAIVIAEGTGPSECQWEKEHRQLRNNSLLRLPDKACVTFHGFVLSQSPKRDLVRVPLLTLVIFGSLQLQIMQIYAARARSMLKIMLCSNIQLLDFMSFSDLLMQNSRLSDNTIFWT